MRETVFTRGGWLPYVTDHDGDLRLELAAGADALHDPRVFSLPIAAAHLSVIRADLTRHLLLWAAILPLCDAAGTRGPLDEDAAIALLDPILLRPQSDVESLFTGIRWDRRRLIAHGAGIALLARGDLFAALSSATLSANWQRVHEYDANRHRTARGVRLTPLDTALLKYTGRYLHGGKKPSREPDAVDPELLPEVLRVIATAELACAGMSLSPGWSQSERTLAKRREWQRIEKKVERMVRRTYPRLADDAVRTVSFLMCSEAAARAA